MSPFQRNPVRSFARPLIRGGTFLAVPALALLITRGYLPSRAPQAPPELKPAHAGTLERDAAPEVEARVTAEVMAGLETRIREQVRKAPARLASVYVQDIESGLVAAANADDDHIAASLIKLPVMGAVYEKWEAEPKRKTRNARTWMEGMITVSDNASTDRLIDLVNGPEVVTRFCADRGWDSLKVRHAIINQRGRRGLNQCTAREIGELLAALDRRELVSESADEEMWQVMCRSKKLRRIPAGVPNAPGILVGNKTGTLSKVLHDSAIVRAPHARYVLCILLTRQRSEPAGDAFCRNISRLVFDTLHGPLDPPATTTASAQ